MKTFTAIAAAAMLVTSQTSLSQTAPSGRFQLRPVTPSGACLTNDQGFGARLPFVKHVQCPAGPPREEANYWWDFAAQPGGLVQIRHSFTNRCATVARGVVFGPPAIDLRPCEFPIPRDQLFRLVPKNGGVFEFRTASDKCWYWRFEAMNSEHIQRDCGLSTAFRLVPAN